MISAVASQRPRAATVVKVAGVHGLAQIPNQTFGDAFPLFKYLILSFKNGRQPGPRKRFPATRSIGGGAVITR